MKKVYLSALILCLVQLGALAQRVVHRHYVTYYNAAKMEPDSVVWDLSPAMVSCTNNLPRHDHFMADPQLPGSARKADYARSGFSKGHLFNWDDARCDTAAVNECFYMSNMLPQNQAFNAGDWEAVERYERTLARTQSIHIIAGGTGSIGTTPGGVNEPAAIWKAIYVGSTWTCWMMPNQSTSTGHSYTYWEIPVTDLDRQTGLNLHNLPPQTAALLMNKSQAQATSPCMPDWFLVAATIAFVLLMVYILYRIVKALSR